MEVEEAKERLKIRQLGLDIDTDSEIDEEGEDDEKNEKKENDGKSKEENSSSKDAEEELNLMIKEKGKENKYEMNYINLMNRVEWDRRNKEIGEGKKCATSDG